MRVNVSTEQYTPAFNETKNNLSLGTFPPVGQEITHVEDHSAKHPDLAVLAPTAVMQIFNQMRAVNSLQPYKPSKVQMGRGSGLMIDDKIFTNFHVIKNPRKLEAAFPATGSKRYELEVYAAYPEGDLAILRFKKKPNLALHNLVLGNSDAAVSGTKVVAIGYPLGRTGQCLTGGMISSHQQLGPNEVLQHDAAINPGNSGGPLVDVSTMQVYGINSSIIKNTNNVGFAIPANDIKTFYENVKILEGRGQKAPILISKPITGLFCQKSNEVQTAYLGNPQQGGYFVKYVLEGGLFDQAGLKSGDQIYEVNGNRVEMTGDTQVSWSKTPVSLSRILNRLTFGEDVSIQIYRNGKSMLKKMTYEECDPREVKPVYSGYGEYDYDVVGGLVVSELTQNHVGLLMRANPLLTKYLLPENLLKPAVVITWVMESSYLFNQHIPLAGAIITKVNGTPIHNMKDFRKVFQENHNEEYYSFETDVKTHFVLEKSQILSDHKLLSEEIRFPVSLSMKSLLPKSLVGAKVNTPNSQKEKALQEKVKQVHQILSPSIQFQIGDKVQFIEKQKLQQGAILLFSKSGKHVKIKLEDGRVIPKKVLSLSPLLKSVPEATEEYEKAEECEEEPVMEETPASMEEMPASTPIEDILEELSTRPSEAVNETKYVEEEVEFETKLMPNELKQLQVTLGLQHLSLEEIQISYQKGTLF